MSVNVRISTGRDQLMLLFTNAVNMGHKTGRCVVALFTFPKTTDESVQANTASSEKWRSSAIMYINLASTPLC